MKFSEYRQTGILHFAFRSSRLVGKKRGQVFVYYENFKALTRSRARIAVVADYLTADNCFYYFIQVFECCFLNSFPDVLNQLDPFSALKQEFFKRMNIAVQACNDHVIHDIDLCTLRTAPQFFYVKPDKGFGQFVFNLTSGPFQWDG